MADGNKLFGFGNIASSAVNAGLGLYSLHQQKKENEKTREYNFKLAQMQNQWNVEQWQRENDYNNPANQVARIKAAGLNPDLIYGGGIQNTSATSPQMSAGAAAAPMDWSSLANINPVNSYLDAQLKQAQIDNINADTNKKGAETSILTDEKKFLSALRQGQIDLQNIQISVADKNMQLTDSEIRLNQAKLTEIEASVSSMNANITKLFNDMDIDLKRLELDKLVSDAQLREIASRCSLNYEQANRYRSELQSVLRQYDDEHDLSLSMKALYDSQKDKVDSENGLLQISKDGAKFKLDVATLKKRDLTTAQNYVRFNDELFKAVLSSL